MPSGACYEVDDGKAGGYGWSDLATAASHANTRPSALVLVPKRWSSCQPWRRRARRCCRAGAPLVSLGKLNELYHPDWAGDAVRGSRSASAWRPQRGLETGLRQTMDLVSRAGLAQGAAGARSDAVPRAGRTRS